MEWIGVGFTLLRTGVLSIYIGSTRFLFLSNDPYHVTVGGMDTFSYSNTSFLNLHAFLR